MQPLFHDIGPMNLIDKLIGKSEPPTSSGNRATLFAILNEYREAVAARDEFNVRRIQILYGQHKHLLDACFKAVNRRLRYQKRMGEKHNLGPTP